MDTFESFLQRVGGRIRELRLALGLSIEAVALRSHVHPSFWSQVERGVKQPSLKSIHRMAAGLRCSPADILEMEGSDPGPVIRRELAALVGERPTKELSRLLAVMREVLGYWETETSSPRSCQR
ncbi:MAG: helix-turn-helix domain-containing protein [Candidatus Riflebacteria bacterium]|nr:helix-turn-helix domain-containing protein [Candidatus Riflebacteria bacterium]